MGQPTSTPVDESITEAVVRGNEIVRIGDGVKHFGQRWTGCATAKVVGFKTGVEGYRSDWVRVVVENLPGVQDSAYGTEWDYDRTEKAAIL